MTSQVYQKHTPALLLYIETADNMQKKSKIPKIQKEKIQKYYRNLIKNSEKFTINSNKIQKSFEKIRKQNPIF